MTFKNALRSAPVLLVWLCGNIASAESYPSVIEDSLRQFPAGSLDRVPTGTSPLSETLQLETSDRITLDKTTTIEFGAFVPAADQPGTFKPAPLKLVLEQTAKLNRTKNIFEFELKLGNSTYSSVEELQAAITKLPKGTQITWAPGCCLLGGEPLQAHWKDFKALCDKQGIILVVIPSG